MFNKPLVQKRHSPHSRAHKQGLPPGSLVYVGDHREKVKARISVIEYDADHFSERDVEKVEDLFPLKPAPTVTWINVDGVHQLGVLEAFQQQFNLSQLLMEDVLNTDHRPKTETTDTHVYVILKMFDFNHDSHAIHCEQVSLVLGERLIITFQEEVGNELDPVRERLRKGGSRLRKAEAGYLMYAILDVIVDGYFNVLEKIGSALEDIEESILTRLPANTLKHVHHLKREMIFLRKSIWPVREVLSNLQHDESPLIPEAAQPYLRDVYDHIIQIMDTLETYRDLLSGVQDLYHSILGNRMNEIMKVLTIISTLFIPLTFIVGVYGMNFEFMPELHSHWGYPVVWLVMILITVFLLFYFRRKHWI